MVLDLDDELGGGVLLRLRQILVQSRQGLSVGESLRAQRREIGLLHVVLAVLGAVDHHQYSVGRLVHVALRSVCSQILRVLEARNGVVRRTLLGVITSVSYHLSLRENRRRGEKRRRQYQKSFHKWYVLWFKFTVCFWFYSKRLSVRNPKQRYNIICNNANNMRISK